MTPTIGKDVIEEHAKWIFHRCEALKETCDQDDWAQIHEKRRDYWRREALATLTAVYPSLRKLVLEEAAREIAALQAREKELLKLLQQKWCAACGTVTSDGECDCTAFEEFAPLQDLRDYAGEVLKMCREEQARAEKAEAELARIRSLSTQESEAET